MAIESISADIEGSVFQVLEGVVYYVDPTTSSNATNAFVGSKERVRIPLSGKHCSLQTFVKHVVEHAGLREEAQKRGLGSSIDIKLCRLGKVPDGNKAYAKNTLAQWDEERSMFSNRRMVLQVMEAIFNAICGWLQAGYSYASNFAKWIWDKVKCLCELAWDTIKTISERVGMSFSYCRERYWTTSGDPNGQNGNGPFEVGHDTLNVRVGINREATPEQGPCLPSDPEKRKKVRDEMKEKSKEGQELCEGLLEYFKGVQNIMNEDEQLDNQQETERKLKQLNQTTNTKKLREALEKQPSVNKSLS